MDSRKGGRVDGRSNSARSTDSRSLRRRQVYGSRLTVYGKHSEPSTVNCQLSTLIEVLIFGRGDWIRTSDLSVPNRALYQAEPRPVKGRTPSLPHLRCRR